MKANQVLKLPNMNAQASLGLLDGGFFHHTLALTLHFLPASTTPSSLPSFTKEGFLKELRELLEVKLPKVKLIVLEGNLDLPTIISEMLLATLRDRNYTVIARNRTDMRLPFMEKLNYLIQVSSSTFCYVICNEFWFSPESLEALKESKLNIELPVSQHPIRLILDCSKFKIDKDELFELMTKSDLPWSVL